jgi:hypothetical protein
MYVFDVGPALGSAYIELYLPTQTALGDTPILDAGTMTLTAVGGS